MLRLILVLLLIFSTGWAYAISPIEGSWEFYKRIYKNEPTYPTHTQLIFEFYSGDSRIFWKHVNEDGFCERTGKYQYNPPILTDIVTWVNPKNMIECGIDPDMRLGNKTHSTIKIENNELLLFLPLADDEMIYVFKRIR